ncbi:soluble lytic murein transglycosylase-like protein [Bartonella fuyuanensis]|uniref:Soluble lytic murein transglycosylase-like protein n=1 Tax=Bartonella fuyuanensis TaxID=1460968 RepID=A0A840E446_9HYPH|nr:transglycosylase SLT domain-containing protein [Bartonella fuyuanensis]MBB4076569.1 soluble lytic murein transglycosylase-like protein [Bartonella fuyuanensis]
MRFLRIFLNTACAVFFVFELSWAHRVLNVAESREDSVIVASQVSARPYESLIQKLANKYNVPVNLAHAVVKFESNYKASIKGAAGEIGLMQIKPSTARGLGFNGSVQDLYDPATNLEYGMRYLGRAYKLSGGSTCGTILKYNAGHAAKKMNSISAKYCAKVKTYLASLK